MKCSFIFEERENGMVYTVMIHDRNNNNNNTIARIGIISCVFLSPRNLLCVEYEKEKQAIKN